MLNSWFPFGIKWRSVVQINRRAFENSSPAWLYLFFNIFLLIILDTNPIRPALDLWGWCGDKTRLCWELSCPPMFPSWSCQCSCRKRKLMMMRRGRRSVVESTTGCVQCQSRGCRRVDVQHLGQHRRWWRMSWRKLRLGRKLWNERFFGLLRMPMGYWSHRRGCMTRALNI